MIGYYVHHQGLGHLQRMRSIAGHLQTPLTVLSSLADPVTEPSVAGWVHLPMDNLPTNFPDPAADPTAQGTLHWVPRHNNGLRRRMALIAEWIDVTDPDLMVVDVSVEVAMLCRLLGVPTVVVAMRGDRFDRAHRTAYDSAHALLAPWPAKFAEPDWPESWRNKTFHSGAISRFADRHPPIVGNHDGPPRALVLWGTGGDGRPMDQINAAISATPGWEWLVAGVGPGRADIWQLLCWADVVITHGGQGAVAEVAAARRPAVVIAEQRPHGEQVATVRALADAGLAVALQSWPDPSRWPKLMAAAAALDGDRWTRWAPPDAAHLAAGLVVQAAREVRHMNIEPVDDSTPGITEARSAASRAAAS